MYHRVKPGESLSVIGEAYGVPYREIARANHIRDVSRIYVGQKLLVPGAEREITRSLSGRRKARSSTTAAKHTPSLRWPMQGAVLTSRFGPRGGRFHDGIDLAAPIGSPIRAAAPGTVVFDQWLSGYGRVIILRHRRGFSTVYAHNSKHYVRKGQRVKAGQLIAAVGQTGRATGPNLHFEVRRDNVARDPLLFLPRRNRVLGKSD